jgi:glycosyltransferase involved in cell wall biosynthesis
MEFGDSNIPSEAPIIPSGASWICFQIGARDHYAVPRALARDGKLGILFTDAWRTPGLPRLPFPMAKALSNRWHPDLAASQVESASWAGLFRELKQKIRNPPPWEKIHARNRWFQGWAIGRLEHLWKRGDLAGTTHCFAYSYAAKEIFGWCRQHGIRCVLGQVDPGPSEWEIVRALRAAHPGWDDDSEPPGAYWSDWQRELELADVVMVNSEWSAKLLASNLPAGKTPRIVPLAYESAHSAAPRRRHPEARLQVLYLGQICLRKGIHEVVEAARLLEQEPVEFNIVGDFKNIPVCLPRNLHFHGRVPRADVGGWYASSDVFILPTHSDGFALTQVEAMFHGLPVVATNNCGKVVQDRVNGWILPTHDPRNMADILRKLRADPDLLARASANAKATSADFRLDSLTRALACLD